MLYASAAKCVEKARLELTRPLLKFPGGPLSLARCVAPNHSTLPPTRATDNTSPSAESSHPPSLDPSIPPAHLVMAQNDAQQAVEPVTGDICHCPTGHRVLERVAAALIQASGPLHDTAGTHIYATTHSSDQTRRGCIPPAESEAAQNGRGPISAQSVQSLGIAARCTSCVTAACCWVHGDPHVSPRLRCEQKWPQQPGQQKGPIARSISRL